MKLTNLYIKNINSFKGDYEIDFTKFNSLFLISGDTGSGKTTIIDSIITALYDKTPRLTNTKELLNSSSKEAKIILDFEVKNDNYQAIWEFKNRGKTDSKKRKLLKNGDVIADKSKQINEEMKKILNLDFSEFTKSVVLAQGEFDAFLSAESKEKTKVLENIIPNIKEYETISKNIYEQTKFLEQEIINLKDKLNEIDENEIKQKETNLNTLQETIQKLNTKKTTIQKNVELQAKKENLKIEINTLNSNIQNYTKKIKELEKYNFEEFKKEYYKKIEFLEEKILLEETISNLETQINSINKSLKKDETDLSTTKEKLSQKQKELNEITIYQIPENFDEISKNYYELQNLRKEYKKQKKEKELLKTSISTKQNELNNLENEYQQTKTYFEYLEAKQIVLKYEEDRKILKENEPCPLCGSTTHPYRLNPPASSKEYNDTKRKLETLKTKIEKLQKEIELDNLNLSKIDLEKIEKEGKKLSNNLGIKEDEFDTILKQKQHNDKFLPIKNNLALEIAKLNTNLKNLNNNIKKYSDELQTLQKELTIKLQNRYQKAKKEKSELQKEYEKLSKIDKELSNYKSLLQKDEEELKNKTTLYNDINIENKNYKEELKEVENKLADYNQEKGSLIKEIEHLKEILNQNKNLQKTINEKNKTFRIYQKINSKIGSKDGDKFKRIAINYMMDNLLNVCNEHLDILFDERYILTRSEKVDELDLFVVDRWHSNTIRSIKTLSGGEKFLVSLALAFGLNDILQKQIKMESMFLDEGFGSLSEDVLDLVINRLQKASKGKTIGIISHVDILKSEIPKQIKIVKKGKKSEIVID